MNSIRMDLVNKHLLALIDCSKSDDGALELPQYMFLYSLKTSNFDLGFDFQLSWALEADMAMLTKSCDIIDKNSTTAFISFVLSCVLLGRHSPRLRLIRAFCKTVSLRSAAR